VIDNKQYFVNDRKGGKDLDLVCHPDTPDPRVVRVLALARLTPDHGVVLTYTVEGAVTELNVPAPDTPRRSDRLWEHTCFEVFLAIGEDPAYCEYNFAPSGHWAAYAFKNYRDSIPPAPVVTPHIAVRVADHRLELDAWITLPETMRGKPLCMGCTAVLEYRDGARTYWALSHPAGRPDFHHRDGFAGILDPTHFTQSV